MALPFLWVGGWVLWRDRIDRDESGFVTLPASELSTDTYAIVGELRGDGPSWVYGSTILGQGRIRVTSESGEPLFIGIARGEDVSRYLAGAGYATILRLLNNEVAPHEGNAPAEPSTQGSIWAASSEGTGRQTLDWTPRAGDWRLVIMNADASSGVAIHGDVAAEFPALPWIAGVALIGGVFLLLIGIWLIAGAMRR